MMPLHHQRDRIAQLVAARELTFLQIAGICKCCSATVTRVAQELRVAPINPRGRRGHPQRDRIAELLQLRQLSRAEIAATCRASIGTVNTIASDLGIKRLPQRASAQTPGKRGRRASIAAGDQFGQLTALDVAGQSAKGVLLWRCSCSCGNTREARTDQLRSGRVTKCKECSKATRREAFKVAKATTAATNRPPRGGYPRIAPQVRQLIVQWLRDGVQGAEISRRTGVTPTTISKIKGALK